MQIVKTIKIGKSSSNDFVINDETVSRQHAVLAVFDSGEITIKDLNSTNGTFVDGKRINDTTQLKPGQIVLLGKTIIDWQKLASDALKPQPKNYRPTDAAEVKKIGKELDNDIRFPYPDISRRHALLCRKQNGSISIVDCDSTNGTFVNGQRINGEMVLHHGDKVLMANKYPFEWEKVFITTPPPSQILKWVVGIAATLAVIVGLWFLIGGRELPPAKIYAMYKNSVVLIYQETGYRVSVNGKPIGDLDDTFSTLNYCHVEDGEPEPGITAGSGTGFFISNDGKIMTNRHVVSVTDKEKEKEADLIKEAIRDVFVSLAKATDDDNEASAFLSLAQKVEVNYVESTYILLNDTHFGSRSDLIPCSVIKTSQIEDLDVAIIQINTKETPSLVKRIVNLNALARTKDMEIGDKLYTIGFPKSFTYATTNIGIEANNQSGEITQEQGEYTYGHNITIQHGASGSPVFDCHGRFAGIIATQWEINGVSTGFNGAVQPQKAADFAK